MVLPMVPAGADITDVRLK